MGNTESKKVNELKLVKWEINGEENATVVSYENGVNFLYNTSFFSTTLVYSKKGIDVALGKSY